MSKDLAIEIEGYAPAAMYCSNATHLVGYRDQLGPGTGFAIGLVDVNHELGQPRTRWADLSWTEAQQLHRWLGERLGE